jgi:hypothetical protein
MAVSDEVAIASRSNTNYRVYHELDEDGDPLCGVVMDSRKHWRCVSLDHPDVEGRTLCGRCDGQSGSNEMTRSLRQRLYDRGVLDKASSTRSRNRRSG